MVARSLWMEGGMNRENTGNFHATILYDTIMKEPCHCTFVQTHAMYNTKSEPSCKLWILDNNDVLG